MKNLILIPCCLLACSISTSALSATDSDAAIVELRKSCNVNGANLHNCFEDTLSLTNWIADTRSPITDASAPLKINIGPGTFDSFSLKATTSGCHISIVGSGRQQTNISDNGKGLSFSFPDHCVLSVSDLTIENSSGFFAIYLISRPIGSTPGETTWTDVEVISRGYGWQGINSCDTKHSWFNSRFIVRPGTGPDYARSYITCAEDWFYSSEITALAENTDPAPRSLRALEVLTGGEVHLYASIVRTIAGQGVILQSNKVVTASISGDMHIHGTAIDVLSDEANDVTVFNVQSNGHVHANETSYNLKTGGDGTITRLSNNGGIIRAPAVWEASSYLPKVVSITGQDTAVYTGTVDGHPHNVVYDTTCINKWFDTTSSECL